ncbi:four helix bundle protein, partial [Arthrospira platensis SPKY1]|nr:four helix bundle protein [Arthrospira platensis SPKY1]
SARATSKDKAYFTNISYGSCMELFDHINAALDLEYLNTVVYEDLRVKLDVIVAKLNNLYHYQINDEKDLKLKAKKL